MGGRILSGGEDSPLEEKYELGAQIGRGTFAVVTRARHRLSDDDVAIKEVSKKQLDPNTRKMLQNEYQSLKQVSRHPGIVTLNEAFETDDSLYFVMELVSGGPLLDTIVKRGSFSENDARIVIASVLKTLSFMSSLGVVHRDIKPENLLVDPLKPLWPLKLTDFGLSAKIQAKERLYDVCGTPYFVAPEVLSGKGYGSECDIWSIGVVLYIILCGYPPFFHEDHKELFTAICTGSYSFPEAEWQHVSEDAKDAIRKMLQVDTNSRLSAQDCLKLPWFSGAQSTSQLPNQKLSDFNAKRKMKSVMIAAKAGVNFMSLLQMKTPRNPAAGVAGFLRKANTSALPALTTSERQQISSFTKVNDAKHVDSPAQYLSASTTAQPTLKSLLYGEGSKEGEHGSGLPEKTARSPLEQLINEHDPDQFARKVGLLLMTINTFYSIVDEPTSQSLTWNGLEKAGERQEAASTSVLRRLKTARSAAKAITTDRASTDQPKGGAWGELKKTFSIAEGVAEKSNSFARKPPIPGRSSASFGKSSTLSGSVGGMAKSAASNSGGSDSGDVDFGEFGGLDDLLSTADGLGELVTSPYKVSEVDQDTGSPTTDDSAGHGRSPVGRSSSGPSSLSKPPLQSLNSGKGGSGDFYNLVRSATTVPSRKPTLESLHPAGPGSLPPRPGSVLKPRLEKLNLGLGSPSDSQGLQRAASSASRRPSLKPPSLGKIDLNGLTGEKPSKKIDFASLAMSKLEVKSSHGESH